MITEVTISISSADIHVILDTPVETQKEAFFAATDQLAEEIGVAKLEEVFYDKS